jgi:cysteine desulfurase
VLEPLEELERQGFEVTRVPVNSSGRVSADAILEYVGPDTLLVSVMHANNETGVLQPIMEIAEGLAASEAYFHVDAAQGFGKDLDTLRKKRIDLISISGHKIYGPKGIGALVARRRGYQRPPLRPLMFGGGQERGVRPGTLPVPLIVGLGVAAQLAAENHEQRSRACEAIRQQAITELSALQPTIHGDPHFTMPHVLNLSFPGVDAEAAMVALKDVAAVSNGSACTSSDYTPSHVLTAMGLEEDEIQSALRLSWCHLTGEVDWTQIRERLAALQ